MSNRLDILIFGATGYTGQYVVEEMARRAQNYGVKWGVAGRTVDKLKQVLNQASTITGAYSVPLTEAGLEIAGLLRFLLSVKV